MKDKALIGATLGTLILVGVVTIFTTAAWQRHTEEKKVTRAFDAASQLIAEKRPKKALELLRNTHPFVQENRREEKAALEIECFLQMSNIPRLLHLHDQYPQLFRVNEDAALFACRALLQTGNGQAHSDLRGHWRDKEKNTGAWFALDVDAFIMAGQHEDALQMLTTTKFTGETEALRLTRLALLTAPENLEKAWGYLEEASALAPYNSDIRLFRGQILERMGKSAAARVEYVAAHLAEPKNPRLLDQLAEFYRRQGSPQLALSVWKKGLTPEAPGFLQLKAMFWGRMVTPLKREMPLGPSPDDRLAPLLGYLKALPDTKLWDGEAFFKVPNGALLLSSRQELFWLRVVDHLSRNQETQALLLLERNPFHDLSWNPELEEALVAILRYRKWGAFPQNTTGNLATTGSTPLFSELATRRDKPSPEVAALLESPEVFSAIFLAGGWLEAALFLHRMPELPPEFPEWVPYSLAQAFRYNKGAEVALSFVEKQPETPAMGLLRAELLLSRDNTETGMVLLEKLAVLTSDVGFRAAWLLAMASLEDGETTAAKQAIAQQPRLAQSPIGHELMARIAVIEGKTTEATRLYASMVQESSEAKVWLARQAFKEKRWEDARRLTIELTAAHPETLQFRENLFAIGRAMETEAATP